MLKNRLLVSNRLTIFVVIVMLTLSSMPASTSAQDVVPDDPTKWELWFDITYDEWGNGPQDDNVRITASTPRILLYDADGNFLAQATPTNAGAVFDIEGYQGTNLTIEFGVPSQYPLLTGAWARTLGGTQFAYSVTLAESKARITFQTSAVLDTYLTASLSQYSTLVVSRWCDTDVNGKQDDAVSDDCPILSASHEGAEYLIGEFDANIRVYPGMVINITAVAPNGKDFTVTSSLPALEADGDNDVGWNGETIRPFRVPAGRTYVSFDIGLMDDPVYLYSLMIPVVLN